MVAMTGALRSLRDALRALGLGLGVAGAEEARRRRDEVAGQIDDYLLPRLERMDAPALLVIGGSTGAGKSTLVNSLVGADVSPASVLRPTTRAPVLVCHPDDRHWFADERVLPGMARVSGAEGAAAAGARGLHLVETPAVSPGIALLDAPDIDSVVEANRTLAHQLLAAADAWLFVTTAARYADAVPWDLLGAASERGTALSLVLNRVPPGAEAEVAAHLRDMLAERGLGETELLVVAEAALSPEGRLPDADLAPLRRWLDALSANAAARDELVRRTLAGALDSLPARVAPVLEAVGAQAAAGRELRASVADAYERAREDVDEAVRSGALLRGEVLARWHDVVGTGDVMRALEDRIGRLRDRFRAVFGGPPPAGAELRDAVQSSVDALVCAAADRAAERAAGAWEASPHGREVLRAAGERLDAPGAGLADEVREEVRRWQGFVFDLVREEGQDKRTSARLASLGVNGAGLTVMLAVFVHTGGLTGAEVAVAGGTSAVGQKVLEAIFGDQAVRTLAARAREDLMARVERLLDAEALRFHRRLPPEDDADAVRDALAAVAAAR